MICTDAPVVFCLNRRGHSWWQSDRRTRTSRLLLWDFVELQHRHQHLFFYCKSSWGQRTEEKMQRHTRKMFLWPVCMCPPPVLSPKQWLLTLKLGFLVHVCRGWYDGMFTMIVFIYIWFLNFAFGFLQTSTYHQTLQLITKPYWLSIWFREPNHSLCVIHTFDILICMFSGVLLTGVQVQWSVFRFVTFARFEYIKHHGDLFILFVVCLFLDMFAFQIKENVGKSCRPFSPLVLTFMSLLDLCCVIPLI